LTRDASRFDVRETCRFDDRQKDVKNWMHYVCVCVCVCAIKSLSSAPQSDDNFEAIIEVTTDPAIAINMKEFVHPVMVLARADAAVVVTNWPNTNQNDWCWYHESWN
jgi:hypothetical protein